MADSGDQHRPKVVVDSDADYEHVRRAPTYPWALSREKIDFENEINAQEVGQQLAANVVVPPKDTKADDRPDETDNKKEEPVVTEPKPWFKCVIS